MPKTRPGGRRFENAKPAPASAAQPASAETSFNSPHHSRSSVCSVPQPASADTSVTLRERLRVPRSQARRRARACRNALLTVCASREEYSDGQSELLESGQEPRREQRQHVKRARESHDLRPRLPRQRLHRALARPLVDRKRNAVAARDSREMSARTANLHRVVRVDITRVATRSAAAESKRCASAGPMLAECFVKHRAISSSSARARAV